MLGPHRPSFLWAVHACGGGSWSAPWVPSDTSPDSCLAPPAEHLAEKPSDEMLHREMLNPAGVAQSRARGRTWGDPTAGSLGEKLQFHHHPTLIHGITVPGGYPGLRLLPETSQL